MVSLWGTKNDNKGRDEDDEQDGDNQSSRAPEHGHREPDERTRLIPPPNNDGYLDPDDPAVSTSIVFKSGKPNKTSRYPRTIYGACGLSTT